MILDIGFMFGVVALVLAEVIYLPSRRRAKRRERHARCLANIARIERKVFPHLFPKPDPTFHTATLMYPAPIRHFDMRPGAVWVVDDPGDIRPAVTPW